MSRIYGADPSVFGARTGTGSVVEPTPERVRAAQLVLASAAADDPRAAAYDRDPGARDALREIFEALGIFNQQGKIMSRPARRPNSPAGSQAGLPRTYRQPGEREPSGRLSRRGTHRSKRRKSEDEV